MHFSANQDLSRAQRHKEEHTEHSRGAGAAIGIGMCHALCLHPTGHSRRPSLRCGLRKRSEAMQCSTRAARSRA